MASNVLLTEHAAQELKDLPKQQAQFFVNTKHLLLDDTLRSYAALENYYKGQQFFEIDWGRLYIVFQEPNDNVIVTHIAITSRFGSHRVRRSTP